MQIQCGKLYENRTWKYLYPSLKAHGELLMEKLSKLFKLGVGIGDSNIKIEEGNCIYIVVDTRIPFNSAKEMDEYQNTFSKFLDWLSYKPYYVTDYLYDNICGSEKHMLVLKLPMEHDVAYLEFIKGNYSKMYTPKVINKYFKFKDIPDKKVEKEINLKIKNTRDILTKDREYLQTFCSIVTKDFNTFADPYNFWDAELDYPPVLKEEIFNFKEKKKDE